MLFRLGVAPHPKMGPKLGGTPSWPGMWVPHYPDLGWGSPLRRMGVSCPDLRWGTPLSWDGVPLGCKQTENIIFRHSADAGGNNWKTLKFGDVKMCSICRFPLLSKFQWNTPPTKVALFLSWTLFCFEVKLLCVFFVAESITSPVWNSIPIFCIVSKASCNFWKLLYNILFYSVHDWIFLSFYEIHIICFLKYALLSKNVSFTIIAKKHFKVDFWLSYCLF